MNNLLAQGAVSRNQAQVAQRERKKPVSVCILFAQAGTQIDQPLPKALMNRKKRIEQLRTQHQARTF